MRTDTNRALVLGFTAGLRSATPLAILAWVGPAKLRRLRSPWSKALTTTGAVAELVADKLPSTPDRTSPALVAGRLAMGATAGYLVTRRFAGICLGAIGALAGTFAGFHVRRFLTRERRLPGLPIALAEDAIALGLTTVAARG